MISIRHELPEDEVAIHALHVACFPTDAEANLVSSLRQANRLSISLVAVHSERIVGHVAFSPVTLASGATGRGLAPLAVLERNRRQGVGSKLVRSGLAECRAAGFGWAVVLGEPAYYSRFGFRSASLFKLVDEYGGGSAFQVIELTPDAIPLGGGVVRYAPEFAVFE